MKQCKYCRTEIDKKAKVCPNCHKKQGSIIVGIFSTFCIIIIAIAVFGGDNNSKENNKFEKNKENTVTVANFSSMTEAEIDSWCNTNKINCSITSEYSNSIVKDGFVSQSVDADKTIYEGDKIKIIFSLGKEPTNEQKNALKKAESYSKTMHMSKKGIYRQLTSAIEGFDEETAQYAIDNMTADWFANALEKAKSYQKNMSMSKKAIYNQLTSSIEGFTNEEAQYAIDHLED